MIAIIILKNPPTNLVYKFSCSKHKKEYRFYENEQNIIIEHHLK